MWTMSHCCLVAIATLSEVKRGPPQWLLLHGHGHAKTSRRRGRLGRQWKKTLQETMKAYIQWTGEEDKTEGEEGKSKSK